MLEADVHDLQLTLMMSSINSLVDLIEDEVIPEVMPMKVKATDVKVTLKVSVRGQRSRSSFYPVC